MKRKMYESKKVKRGATWESLAEDAYGDRYLAAYLSTNENPSPSISEARSFMQQKLPDYMIPSAFVFLDTLPRTPNGKDYL